MTYPLLQINNLSVDFVTDSENVSAIKNISFEINKSETVSIVGESGSGKTDCNQLPGPASRASAVQRDCGQAIPSCAPPDRARPASDACKTTRDLSG